MQSPAENHYRLVVGLCAFTAIALTPFTIYHLFHREWFMALTTGGLNVVLGIGAFWLYALRDNAALIRRATQALLLAANLTVVLNVYAKGGPTMFWVYPMIFANFYLLPMLPGVVASVVTSAICVAIAAPTLTGDYLSRVVVAIPLCILFGVVFSQAVARQRRQLQYLATHDTLTGLRNRYSLGRDLADAVARRRRYGEACSLVLFDIDQFKAINDTMGHLHADAVIADLARLLKERIRIVDRLFRYGGEEFVLLLPHANARPSWQLGEAMRMEVEEHTFAAGTRITISAGVASLNEGEDAEQWLKRADDALYEAKNAGRNRVCLAANAAMRAEDNGPDATGRDGSRGPRTRQGGTRSSPLNFLALRGRA